MIMVVTVMIVIMMVRAIVMILRRSHHASDATGDTARRAANDAANHTAYGSRRASTNLGPSFTAPNNALGLR